MSGPVAPEAAALGQVEAKMPESMLRMKEQLDKRLAATNEALQLELEREFDADAPSPRHPAPDSPIPHPTKEQIAEMRRAADEEEELQVRARTAASESQKQIEDEQRARFVEHLVRSATEEPATPPASAQKERPARDLERATPSKEYEIPNGSILASAEKLRNSQDMLRRSYDPESWESAARRRHSAAATEMYTLDYEKTSRPETSPPRRRPHSSRPLPRSAAAEGDDLEGGLGVDCLRESLSSRASKRLAEAIHFSAAQSPASPLSQEEEDDEVLYDSDGAS